MTLAELLISMVILSLMCVVMAGMSHAVNSAWEYTKGVDGSEQQASATLDRIKYMVGQTGTYRVTGQPTRLGMAVIERSIDSTTVPDVLVLWTGGQNGGMAALGLQARLPVASELLVYTWSEKSPSHFLEITFPGDSTPMDFAASDFPTKVSTLLTSTTAERVTLCEKLRVNSKLPIGNSRFAIAWAPTDAELTATTPQTSAWLQLNWPQGAVGSLSGMRQATLSVELQIEPDGVTATNGDVSAIPFFGSASVRYVYQP